MTLKNKILTLLIFLSCHTLSAGAQPTPDLRLEAKPCGIVYQSENLYPGSEFLFPDWASGEVYLTSGQIVKGLYINYNALADALVYRVEDRIIEISTHHVLAFSVFEGHEERSFIRSDAGSDSVRSDPGFYEVLYNGSNKLYVKRSYGINTLLTRDNPFNKSVYYPDYKYIALIMGERVLNPQRPAAYYPFYGKPGIRERIRTLHLSLKKEEDLVRFFRELDTIRPASGGDEMD